MSDGDPGKPGKGEGAKPADRRGQRRARQVDALRANLRRRKAQARRQAANAAPRKPPGGD